MLWFWGLTAAERRAYIPPVGRGPERTREAPKGVKAICGEAIVSAAQGPGGRHIARNTRSYRHRCSETATRSPGRCPDRDNPHVRPDRGTATARGGRGRQARRCEASRNALEERPRGGARDESRTLRSCRRPGPRHITTAPRRSTNPLHTPKSQNSRDERTNRQSPKRCRNESSRRERDPSKRVPSVRRPAHDPNPRHG
jgi:hypothetical protein